MLQATAVSRTPQVAGQEGRPPLLLEVVTTSEDAMQDRLPESTLLLMSLLVAGVALANVLLFRWGLRLRRRIVEQCPMPRREVGAER